MPKVLERDQLKKVAVDTALVAGQLLRRYWRGGIPNSLQFKGRNDLVTGADLAACALIKKKLQNAFPHHDFLFEETEFSELHGSDYLWIVDPLDGTTLHNRGLPGFSVVISLRHQNQTILGVTHSPLLGDLFITEKDRGSMHFNQRLRISRSIQVSKTRNLEEAVLGFSLGKSVAQTRQMGRLLKKLFPVCRAIVNMGGAEIGYVASGHCDAFFDNSSTPWDFAALDLMIREADGCSADWHGASWQLDSKTILLTNRLLLNPLLEVIQEVLPRTR
jgi:myo-inositol-1(or 4)-monophosphatase